MVAKPMLKVFKVAIVLVATFLICTSSIFAYEEAVSSADLIVGGKGDLRVEKLRRFLDFYNSPLANYAWNFVNAADKYSLDWKIIPAITGVESTFGKAIPTGSYNAYGWANGAYWFTSWEDSIEIVAKTLRVNYLDKGADTVEKIAPIYAPPSNTWAAKVRYFMEKIENFTPTNTLALELSL